MALKHLGHQVAVATGGAEALAVFDPKRDRVIISDLLMPGMDGLELCRRIRAANASQYTYFILLTVVEGKAFYLEGMKAGADDFLTKPFDTEILGARLVMAGRLLNLQSQLRQLAGLLPICSVCKKVRDDRNYWHQVESYISEHSDAQFTHGYCPDCFQKMLRDVDALEPSGMAGRSR